MGNVSDKVPDNSSTSSSMDSLGTLPILKPASGETSVSLEWFDAPESLSVPSPSVRLALKSNLGVDAFPNEGTKLECVDRDVPLSTSVKPALCQKIFPDLEPRSPTSRFRILSKFSPKKRAFIARLSPYEKHIFLKKFESEEGKRKVHFTEGEQGFMVHEKVETEKNENSENNMVEDGETDNGDVDLPSIQREESVNGSSSPPATLFNTPDVLSDIPSDISLESSPLPPPTSSSEAPPIATSSNFTNADMKRQKKRDRKKARQLNKEQQLKRERLQRAEAIKKREERIEREKRKLAEQDAAVVQTTEVSVEEQLAQQREVVIVVDVEVHQKEEKEEEDTDTSSSAAVSSSCSPDSSDAGSHQRDFCSLSESIETILEQERLCEPVNEEVNTARIGQPAVHDRFSTSHNKDESITPKSEKLSDKVQLNADESDKKHISLPMNQKEELQVETMNGSEVFEVCVDGERKMLKEFTPRSKQNSTSQQADDSQSRPGSSISTTSLYGMHEHEPVIVPFNERPMVANYNFQQPPPAHMAPMFRPGPPPFPNPTPMAPPINPFVQMAHPRFIVQQAFVPPPPPPPPPQFRPVGVVPVQMPIQGVPLHGVPMQAIPFVNHPMFIPPNQGMPMQHNPLRPTIQARRQMPAIQAPPPSSHMGSSQQSSTIYASTRLLVRPVRNPLPITAPPEKQSTSKKSTTKAQKGTVEVQKAQQPNEIGASEKNKKLAEEKEDIIASTVAPSSIVEETVILNQPVVVVEEEYADENAEVSLATELVDEMIGIERGVDIDNKHAEETRRPTEFRRSSSSVDLNGDLITSGVAAVLDESDEEFPPIHSTFNGPLRPLSPTSLAQLEAINRVLDFSKHPETTTFDIWSGWMNEMPPSTKPYLLDDNFKKMCAEDEKTALFEKEIVSSGAKKIECEGKLTLMSICKFMEPYFMNSRAYWAGTTLDGDQLRDIFIEAYSGSIPPSHWRILEKVCCFEQGYFHVFDVLIGSILELTYKFFSAPESTREKCNDELYKLYQSLPPVNGVENFFKRFEEEILPDVLYFLSNRFISIRAFVSIVEVVKEGDLSVSDLYYLAVLVYGARQFFSTFNSKIKQLHIIESGGKRWIRQTTMDEPRGNTTNGLFISNNETQVAGVPDFLSRLRPHIDDILQLLPDSVVNDVEFFKAAKLVCRWSGEHEERVWKSIINDRSKFQEFYDAYRSFLRIEIRMGTIYLRKLTYDGDYDTEVDEKPMKLVAAPHHKALKSSIKNDDNQKDKKKDVSYAAQLNMIAPNAPAEGLSDESTQTDHVDMDQIWDLERQVIRHLKRDNISFAEFIKTDDAREMHQFLIDTFKNMDLRYFAFILEKAMTETHEKSWQETVELRHAAEEARLLLEQAREEHKKEFGELRSRMETISRFEAYEVQVASNSRIDGLKERIAQLNEDRELLLREEVKEERARLQRQLREMKEKHSEEKRTYVNEIARLKEENSRLMADRQKLVVLQSERVEMAAHCESQMNKAKEMCETSTRLLQDSQREIEALRDRHQFIGSSIERPPVYPTPDPEWDSEPESEPFPDVFDYVDPSIPSTSTQPAVLFSPIQLSSEARYQFKMLEKYSAEFQSLELRVSARELVTWYNTTGANHKERRTAEKQLKDYEETLDMIENSIRENLEMLKLNVVDGLLVIPDVPMPFSDKVMQKMREYKKIEAENAEKKHQVTDDEDGCLICTEVVETTCETVTCDTCSKEYHYHCISQWLKINSVCPACSRALKDPNEYPRLE